MTFAERLLEALKRLLTSAKVITALVGLITTFAAKHNIILSPEDVNSVLTIFTVLIGAQGITDWGKTAAQVQAANPPPPTTEQTQIVNVPGKK